MEIIILNLYKKHHLGKENAITRSSFIFRYLDGIVGISDREFRNIYSQLPIVTCSKGGYYPIRREEILEYRDYLRKRRSRCSSGSGGYVMHIRNLPTTCYS